MSTELPGSSKTSKYTGLHLQCRLTYNIIILQWYNIAFFLNVAHTHTYISVKLRCVFRWGSMWVTKHQCVCEYGSEYIIHPLQSRSLSLPLSLFLPLSLPCGIDGRETDYHTLLAHIPAFPSFNHPPLSSLVRLLTIPCCYCCGRLFGLFISIKQPPTC